MICSNCGYRGPRQPCTICSGRMVNRQCVGGYCPRCEHYNAKRIDWAHVIRFVLLIVGAVLLTLALSSLLGCGQEFVSNGDLFADAGSTDDAGDAGASGAGGALVSKSGAAGAPAAAGSGASSAAGASSAGSGGALVQPLPTHDCDRALWRAAAFGAFAGDAYGGTPAHALDGDELTRWASGEPQAVGQWFQVELGAPAELAELVLVSPPADKPQAVAVELDGVRVEATASMPAPGLLRLAFAPRSTRSVRLVIEQPAAGVAWWSILELGGVCRG